MMRIGQVEVVPTVKEVIREFQNDQIAELAAATAFRLILALPALVIFFAALSAAVARYTGVNAFDWLQTQLETAPIPPAVQETIQLLLDTVEQEGNPRLLSFGIILTLWAASGAIDTMINAFNRAYDTTEARSFVRRRLLALGLTIGLSILTITSFVLLVFGQRLGRWLAGWAGLGPTFTLVWDAARWPVIFVFFMFALAILYWAGPALRLSFRWFSPGAIVATVLWVIATYGFSLYLQFTDPGSAYGALGAMIVLLFFLFISSIVLLIGAELNAVLDKKYDPVVIQEKAAHPEQQTDPEETQAQAEKLARREGTSPAEVGVRPRRRRTRPETRKSPPPGRVASVTLLVSVASIFIVAFIRAIRGR